MRLLRVCLTLFVLGNGLAAMPPALSPAGAVAYAQPAQPKQQEEFVPIDELPPQEQVPAAPLVVAAYIFVWVAFLAYVFSLVKRIKKVESDLANLERDRH